MKSLFLAAGVAALAISVPSVAAPGGKGGGKDHATKADHGGGKSSQKQSSHGNGGGRTKADRGPQMRAMKADRGPQHVQKQHVQAQHVQKQERQKMHAPKMQAKTMHQDRQRIDRKVEVRNDHRMKGQDKASRQAFKSDNKRFDAQTRRADNRGGSIDRMRSDDRIRGEDRRLANRFWDGNDDRWDDRFVRGTPAGFVNGCPPGLAKKSPACIPPGQAKQWIGQKVGSIGSLYGIPTGLRDLYRDTDDYYYRYGDGYLYRVDRGSDLVNALMPLFGLGMTVGQPFPYNSSAYSVPSYYQPFYQPYGDDYYRYANGYMYDIDGRSGLIQDIIPLYDRGYGVGQMLPSSYSYYNVPYPYRDMYADNSDYYYRYAPGAIYQVDQKTQLITAIASLLTGNNALGVGQQLPMGYSAYNVPYAYRDQYYDTPDNWYRYSNGNIYQVDPKTRLITALISAIV